MAAKRPPPNITERRLKPIYDALDSGRSKKAIQEADKLIKKHSDLHAARALKSLALIRLSRADAAWPIIHELETLQTTDEPTLQALTHCFKELGRQDRIARMYEAACKVAPRSEDLLCHLFMAYVRMLDFRKQQQSAMQIAKEHPRVTYHFWAIMSTVMQAISNPSLANTMYLPLAKRMAQKYVKDDALESACEVNLYFLLLEMKGDYEEALALLEGPLIEKFHVDRTMWDRKYRILELWQKLERHDDVIRKCCDMLPKNRDDWRLYSIAFTSSFQMLNNDPNRKSDLITAVTDTILVCLDADPEHPTRRYRGPYLARLRWISGLLENDLVVRADLGEPIRLLIEFIDIFGDKPCCCADVRPYLCLLGEQQQKEFLTYLQSSTSCDVPKDAGDINRHVCRLQLARCLGVHTEMNADERMTLVQQCCRLYTNTMHFEVTENSSDFHPADAYMLFVVQLLWDVYNEQSDIAVLHEVAILLEAALNRSPSNFNFALILTKVYVLLGATERASVLCDHMSVKNIQLDSLGYLLFDAHRPFGYFATAQQYNQDTDTYFGTAESEMLEALVNAYYRGAFPQIIDMTSHHEQTLNSIYCLGAVVMHTWLKLSTQCQDDSQAVECLRATKPEVLDSIQWSKLRDNRDFAVMPDWDPGDTNLRLVERSKQSFQELLDMIRYHQLVLRVVSVLSDVECSDDQRRQMLRTISIELKTHHKHCKQTYAQPPTMPTPDTNSFLDTDTQTPEHPNTNTFRSLFKSRCVCDDSHYLQTRMQDAPSVQWHVYLNGGYFDLIDLAIDCAYFIVCQRCLLVGNLYSGGTNCSSTSDSGNVSSATPSSMSSSAATSTDDLVSTVSDLSIIDSGTEMTNKCSSNGKVLTSSVQRRASRDHSPDRLQQLPSTDDVQAVIRRIISSHQLQALVNSTNGGQQPQQTNGVVSNNTDEPGRRQFPHLQLCHISYVQQTIAMALLIVVFTIRCIDTPQPNTTATAKSPTPDSTTKNKQSIGKKKHQSAPPPPTTTKQHVPSVSPAASVANGTANNMSGHVNTDVLLDQLHDLVSVMCQAPITIERLLNDLHMMLDDVHLTRRHAVDLTGCDQSFITQLEELKSTIENNYLRDSYANAIKQMTAVNECHKTFCSKLGSGKK